MLSFQRPVPTAVLRGLNIVLVAYGGCYVP